MHQDTTSSPPAPFTVRLDREVLTALDALVEKTDRSRNWIVARAVEDYVALNAWQIGKIEEGIAAADKGDFASPKAIARLRGKFAS